MGREHSGRITEVQRMMDEQGIDIALVFTSDEHSSEYIDDHYKLREYLTGFTGSAGSLLIRRDKALLWTDGRYFIQAGKELSGSGTELMKSGMPGVPTLMEYIRKAADEAYAKGGKLRIGTDLKLITGKFCNELLAMKDKGVKIKDIDIAAAVWKDRPRITHNRIYGLPDETAGKSTGEKLSELRKYLEKISADSVIISDLGSVMWLFNIRGSDIMYSPVAYSYGYVDREGAYLFAEGSCVDEELRSRLLASGTEVKEYDDFYDHLSWLKGMKTVCDPATLNAYAYSLIRKNELIERPAYHYIKKHIKNETERKLARDRHVEDGLALTRFIYRIKKAVKEGEISGKRTDEHEAAVILDKMRGEIQGNRGLSFETISAYGSNGAIVHYSPGITGSAVLKPEGFLLVDSGGQYEGATTDVTRTIALGKLTEDMKLDYTAVLKGMLDLSDAVFPEGIRGENLDVLARRPIWERFTDYRHGTGHGVGAMLNVHEGPQAIRCRIDPDNQQPPLSEGMITSDEPGIYIEGKYGIRIENLLLCTLKKTNEWGRFLGFDTLTLVPYEREAIVVTQLTERQKRLINDYHRTIYYLYSPRMDREEREWLAEVTAQI